MVIDGDAARASPVNDIGAGAVDGDGLTPSFWPHRADLLAVAALTVVAALAVVVALGRPSGLPEAALLSQAGIDLPAAPTSAVVQRWTMGIAPGDAVALASDRVVVGSEPSRGDATFLVTARHVRSGALLWEQALAERSLVMVVDDQGAVTTTHETSSWAEGADTQPVVALAADDGRRLWEREVSFTIGASAGHVLVATNAGCELVETRTGRTTWQEGTQGCLWLDDDEVMASRRGGWEVHGLDGAATGPPVPGTEPPVAVGQCLAALDDGDLVLMDRDGHEEWRTSTISAESGGVLWSLPGLGVVVSGWDAAAGEPLTGAFDLDGNRLDRDATPLGTADMVEVGGATFVVTRAWHDGGTITTSIHPVHDLDRDVASLTCRDCGGRMIATRQGMLAPTPSGDRLDLHRWPDLTPVWSADLSSIVGVRGGWDQVLTSDSGLVVIAPDAGTLHIYG